jgi:hypothetical protein
MPVVCPKVHSTPAEVCSPLLDATALVETPHGTFPTTASAQVDPNTTEREREEYDVESTEYREYRERERERKKGRVHNERRRATEFRVGKFPSYRDIEHTVESRE